MSRLRKASMLGKPHLTHVRQVVFRPVVKQATTPGLGSRIDGACFLLTGTGPAYAEQPLTGAARNSARRWPGDALDKVNGLRTSHSHRHGMHTFPIDRPIKRRRARRTRGIRYRMGKICKRGKFGVRLDPKARHVLFQLQKYHFLISKLDLTASGDAALGVLVTSAATTSLAVLQGPAKGSIT